MDALTYMLNNRGFHVGRHSYSFRVFYKGRIIAGIHFYPGYREVELRLYRVHQDLAEEAYPEIITCIEKLFPEYRIKTKWFNPVISLE